MRAAGATATRRNEYLKGSSNHLLHLIVASIKSLTNGIRWRSDLDEPMASVMAIGSEVIGECVGEINVSVGMGKQVPGFAVGGYN